MPTFDPATWRLRIEGLVDRPQTLSYDELRSAAARRAGLDVPLRHRLVGARTCTGPACASATSSPRPDRSRGARVLEFVSAEMPYVDTLTLEQAMLARRDARVRDGRQAARRASTARRCGVVIPEMYGYKNVKWVERIVAQGHGRAGLLGAARLRHRRVGRRLEWLLSTGTSAASRARSGRSTGCTRAPSSSCSRSGLVLYVPRLSELVGRRPLRQGRPSSTRARLDARARARRRARRPPGAAPHAARARRASTATTGSGCGGSRAPRADSTRVRSSTPSLTAAFAVLFAVSGLLLWYGERNNSFRFASTIILHDGLMYVSLVLLDRAPLPGAHLPGDAARTARHDDGLGATRLGASSTTRSGSTSSRSPVRDNGCDDHRPRRRRRADRARRRRPLPPA